jgi:hypothetical protein
MRAKGLTAAEPPTSFEGWRVEDAKKTILGLTAPPWRVPGRSTDHPCTLSKSLAPRVSQVLQYAKGLELKEFEGSPCAMFVSMSS